MFENMVTYLDFTINSFVRSKNLLKLASLTSACNLVYFELKNYVYIIIISWLVCDIRKRCSKNQSKDTSIKPDSVTA